MMCLECEGSAPRISVNMLTKEDANALAGPDGTPGGLAGAAGLLGCRSVGWLEGEEGGR